MATPKKKKKKEVRRSSRAVAKKNNKPANDDAATSYVEKLEEANREIRTSRRAALNALEDAIMSKEALRISEEKYRTKLEKEVLDRTAEIRDQAHFIKSITDSVPATIGITRHPSGDVEFYNRDLFILGYRPDEVTQMGREGKTKLVHPEDVNNLKAYFARFDNLKDDEVNRVQCRIKSNKGDWIWQDLAGKVFKRDSEGNVTRTLQIGTDITEQKKSELEIIRLKEEIAQNAEEKFRTLFETMGQGYAELEIIRGPDGRATDIRYLELNPQYERLTGIPVVKALGRTVLEVIPDLDPWWIQEYDRIVRSGRPGQVVNEVTTSGRWYEAKIYPRAGDRFSVLSEEITERKLHERRKEFLLKLSDILSLSDALEIESSACRLVGEELKADRVFYSEFNETDGWMKVRQDYLRGDSPSLVGTYPISAYAWAIPLYRTGNPVIIPDTQHSDLIPPVDRPAVAAAQFASYCVIPLVKNGVIVGSLAASESVPRQWKESEVALLVETAERIWASTERAKAEGALRESRRILARELEDTTRLQRVSSKLLEADDTQELYEEIIMASKAIMDSDAVSMQMLVTETDQLKLIAWKGFHPDAAKYWEWVDAGAACTCGAALAENKRIIVEDVEQADFMQGTEDLNAYRLSGIRSVQSTPLVSRTGKIVGMISNHWHKVHRPSERDFSLLDVLARQLADHFENRRAEGALRKSEELLAKELADTQQLQQFSNEVIHTENGEDIYELVLQAAVSLMRSDFASIQLYWAETKTLTLVGHRNFHPRSAAFWHTVSAASGSVCGEALRNKSRITVRDIEKEDFAKGEIEIFRATGIHAVQSTPLISSNGKLIGMLNTQWKEPRDFSAEDFRFFDVLARQAGDLIEKKQTDEALRKSEERLREFNLLLEQQVSHGTGELKQSQEALKEKNSQLEHSVAQLESFNYIASHDLQEPLRKIQTFVELLNENEISNPDMAEYIAGINVASARMSDLITSLLRYSRLSHPKEAFQPVDLNKILLDIKTDYEVAILEKQATLVSHKLPTISAIHFQMHQLFANLIGNSLKFCERQPEIKISARLISGDEVNAEYGLHGDETYAELVFQDNGIGFDNKYSKKIFEVFQRLHSKTAFSGTGIGLSIVEKIVKQHRGHVIAEGEKGVGAVFTVYLPVE